MRRMCDILVLLGVAGLVALLAITRHQVQWHSTACYLVAAMISWWVARAQFAAARFKERADAVSFLIDHARTVRGHDAEMAIVNAAIALAKKVL